MKRSATVTWWAVGCSMLLASVAAGATERIEPIEFKPGPWPEGAMLKSVDGSLVPPDSNDLWCFEVGRDANELSPPMPAGTRLTLLPSATLEQLVVDVNDRYQPHYRLTAQMTQYRGTNFLWPIYYVPLSRLKDANEPTPVESPAGLPDANEVTATATGGDDMPIPDEIARRLRNRRTARAPQRSGSEESPVTGTPAQVQTRVLVDAVGFIEMERGTRVFVPDALGRNVARVRYELLPCRTLERAEQRLAASPEPMRLKVAGLVTQYRGTHYLLLQRVIRVYDYGNFGG